MKAYRHACITRLSVCLSLALLIFCNASEAATITNLFNTGVDAAKNALASGALVDPHYIITVSPTGPQLAYTVTDTAFPFPPWVINNYTPGAGSRWISPNPNGTGQGPAGNYRYRTTFTVPPNAILSTVNVSGLWSTDDGYIDIFINGSPTGSTTGGHNALWPFSISGGFNYGPNTLVFALNNAGGPTGLRVDGIVGTYQVIPEPATVCLILGAGLLSVTVFRRRRFAMP